LRILPATRSRSDNWLPLSLQRPIALLLAWTLAIGPLGAAGHRNSGRGQGIRARLGRRDGALIASPNGAQGSHVVTSLVGADALALIAPGEGTVEPGTLVPLTPLVR